MSNVSSAPRGERAGRPGTAWETELRRYEVVVDDDHDESPFGWSTPDTPPRPDRATRRAMKRERERKSR